MTNDQFSTLLEYLDEVWPWFVKQQYIEPCHAFILFVGTLLVFYFGARFAKNHWSADKESGYSICEEDHEIPCIFFLIVVGVFVLFFLEMFISEFMDIFNVEYAAFKDITAQVVQAKPK